MLILTNGLTDVADEGFLKVANNLIKRLKKADQSIEIVSYDRKSEITDTFIEVNKFMTNKCIREYCGGHDQVLYVPFPTKKWVMALRVYLLSKFSKKLSVVLVLKTPIGFIGKCLLKRSKAKIIVFSRDAADFYSEIVGDESVAYLKTGVDTQKFSPVSEQRVAELRRKYNFDQNKKIVLHVGHMNEGRNIRQLLKIKEEYQVLLVTSTLTKDEADVNLKNELLSKPNIRIIDEYVPDIQELYQLSDVYFFPVVEDGHCIDVPLSCLEAAACGKTVITTPYGEMKQLIGRSGFNQINDFDTMTINSAIEDALRISGSSTDLVAEYDWKWAIDMILEMGK